jgi:hypothetical protein
MNTEKTKHHQNAANSPFLLFEINKTNTELLSENSKYCHIIGIGKTNYTIHRDANEIKDFYFPKYNHFDNWSINLMHNYHVFQQRLKNICGRIKFRKTFKYKGKTINIKRAFIGIPNYCEIVYNEGKGRTIDSLTCIGQDYKVSHERLMYIVEIL